MLTHQNLFKANNTESSWLQVAAMLLLFMVSLVPGYVLIKYGVHFSDEPYQILNTMDYHNSPLSPLTSYLCGLFGGIVGFNWLAYRYLALTLSNLAIIASGIYLYSDTKRLKFSVVVTCVVIFISGLYRRIPNLFGWDATTLFFTVVTLITLLCYIKRPSVRLLIILAVLSAITTLVRVPNAIIVPVIFAILMWKASDKGIFNRITDKNLLIYIVVTALSVFLILLALYGSLSDYIHYIQANQMGAHQIKEILIPYARSVSKIILMISALLGLCSVMNHFADDGKPKGISGICVIAGLAVLLFVSLYFNQGFTSNLNFPIECVLSGLIYVLYKERDNLHGIPAVQAISAIMLGFVGAFGSNTGLVKYITWALIPITAGMLVRFLSPKALRLYGLVFGVPLVATLILYARVEAFAESGLRYTTHKIENGNACGLYTTAERKQIIDEINATKSLIPEDHALLVLGESTNRFGYEYLFGSRGDYSRHEWSNLPLYDYDSYVDWVKSKLASGGDKIAVIYIKRENDADSKTKSLLDSRVPMIRDTETFSVYGNLFIPK